MALDHSTLARASNRIILDHAGHSAPFAVHDPLKGIAASTMSSMKKTARLPLVGDAPPEISCSSGSTDGMLVFLEELGSHLMNARIGVERSMDRRPAGPWVIEVTRGETYRTPGGNATVGGRYLVRQAGGRIIGALNYTLRIVRGRAEVILSNLAVAKDCRRQGIATRLVDELTQDYSDVRADTAMTGDGAAFMGYAAPVPAAASRPAIPRRRL